MTLDFYLIITILGALSNALLGILVLTRNPRDRVNQSFFAMTIFVCLWLVTNYIVDLFSVSSMALLFINLTELAGAWATYSFLYFVYEGPPYRNDKR